MSFQDDTVSKILASSQELHEKLHALYCHRKALSGKYSLQWICNAAGIPSKGLLSDILCGRRPLPRRYAYGLATALGLVDAQRELILLWTDQLLVGPIELARVQGDVSRILEALRK